MNNIILEYDTENIRWMGYHTALKGFFENVAGLPQVPKNEKEGFGKNIKVVYATPSSAFTKYVIPMVNGLTQRPIITFYLSNEETLETVAGSPFIIHRYYVRNEGEDTFTKTSFTRPLMKSLTYTCNIFTTKMSDCDYMLTLLELRSNKYKPYSCKVNGRPAQFYIDNIKTGTPTDYEGKKFISSSFDVTVPLASIFPAEIETDDTIIKTINAYLSDEVVTVPDEMFSSVAQPKQVELKDYYEKLDGNYVLAEDVEVDPEKTYYIKNEKYLALSKYIDTLIGETYEI